jgi:hypothetical protein
MLTLTEVLAVDGGLAEKLPEAQFIDKCAKFTPTLTMEREILTIRR